MAYSRINWENSPTTTTPISASNLNTMDKTIYELAGGWISADETWTYSSVDDPTGKITIVGDVTTKYSLGMRIKMTNSSNTIYGIITAISYSSPNTTLTFLHEIDPSDNLALHLLQDSTITNNYYSSMKVPFGFPLERNSWSIIILSTTSETRATPTAGSYYNIGSNITIPIGCWIVGWAGNVYLYRSASGTLDLQAGLSTSTSSFSDSTLNSTAYYDSILKTRMAVNKENLVTLTTKTLYYMMVRTSSTNITEMGFYSSLPNGYKTIYAICAYL